jgi:hypothetical protein
MSPFFDRLGRFNSILFTVVGIAVLGLLIMVGISMLSGMSSHDDYEAPVQVDGNKTAGLVPSFQGLEQINGTDIATITVSVPNDYGGNGVSISSKGSYADNKRNILFVNLTDGASRYLLPDNSRLLAQWHVLPDAKAEAPKAEPIYVGQVMVKQDSQSTANKTFDVLIGRFRDGQQKWLLEGVRSLDGVTMLDDGDVTFLYSTGKDFIFARVDGKSLEVEARKTVPVMMMPKPE